MLELFSAVWGYPDGDISEVHVDPLENISKPLHLTYHFHKDNFFRVPSSGANFRVLPPIQISGLSPANPRKGPRPLDVGPSIEQTFRAHIQFPATYNVTAPDSVRMVRDYGEYSSSYTLNKNVLDAERHLVLKVNELLPARRADYESFRNLSSRDVQQFLNCNIARLAWPRWSGRTSLPPPTC